MSRPIYAKRRLALETLETRLTMSANNADQAAAVRGSTKLPYTYSVTGNTRDVGNSPASLPYQNSGLALVGGGTDVDEVFKWMGAKTGGGDFLILRATGTDAYNSYIDRLVPSLDSVATLIIPSRTAALHSDVAQIIASAEAIFIAGGDQLDYFNYWNDTPVESALYQAASRNIPIGGTSAGLAILGEVDFTGVGGTITSSEALANPLDSRITLGLDKGFFSPEVVLSQASPNVFRYLDNVITDSHFMQRDRMGRLVTFMANADTNELVQGLPRGIGVNEQTALLIEPDGLSRVVGNPYTNKKLTATQQLRSVYIAQGTYQNPVLTANVSLNYSVDVVRASYDPVTNQSDQFDLDDLFSAPKWEVVGLDNYRVVASSGTVMTFDATGFIYGEAGVRRRSSAL